MIHTRRSSRRLVGTSSLATKVLVEGPAWAVVDVEQELEADGVEVILCRGSDAPETVARGGCPLLVGRSCPLADSADMVVCADRRASQLLAAHRRRRPSLGIMVIPPGAPFPLGGRLD